MVLLVVTFFGHSGYQRSVIVRVLDGDVSLEVLETGQPAHRVFIWLASMRRKKPALWSAFGQALHQWWRSGPSPSRAPTWDRYGRLLGTVWLGKADVNAAQIRNGLAWAYRFHGKAIRDDYVTTEDEARRQARPVSGQSRVRQNPGAGAVCIRARLLK